MQLFKTKNDTPKQKKNPALQKGFEELKATQVEELATTRTVVLKFSLCLKDEEQISHCGCGGVITTGTGEDGGCIEVDVKRDVEMDSRYQDGDRIHTIEDTDEMINVDFFGI